MRGAQASYARGAVPKRGARGHVRGRVGPDHEDRTMNARTLLRSAFDGMVASRQRQARHYARAHLLTLDDATLARAGISRDDLRRGDIIAR